MTVTLPLPPSTNHGYGLSNGRMYKTTVTKDWEQAALWILKKKRERFPSNATVWIEFYFGSHRRRDIDGGIKYLLDILTKAGTYKDDDQVTGLHVFKYYDKEKPRCELTAMESGV